MRGILPPDEILSGKFHWPAMCASFFDGFHRSVAAFAASGNDLIVEHIVETRKWMSSLLTLLAPFDVFFVADHCPLPELEKREAARGDRPVGDARRDFMSIDLNAVYDLELDGTESPEANVGRLIRAWRGRVRPSAFERMASR
jgi:chloramphenicol 3-O phosphotransferase